MKVRLVSDLHLEKGDFNLPEMPNDKNTVLILAGDIYEGSGVILELYIKRLCKRFYKVVYVMGNHETCNNIYEDCIERMEDFSKTLDNFVFLNNSSIIIDNVKFLGGTLWSEIKEYNEHQRDEYIENSVPDYELTSVRDSNESYNCRLLNTNDTIGFHKKCVGFLEEELSKPFVGKVVVVTHFLPLKECTHPMFAGSILNPYFSTDLSSLFKKYKIDFWCHGHTHTSVDMKYHNTRVLCNPLGYYKGENKRGFNPKLIINL